MRTCGDCANFDASKHYHCPHRPAALAWHERCGLFVQSVASVHAAPAAKPDTARCTRCGATVMIDRQGYFNCCGRRWL